MHTQGLPPKWSHMQFLEELVYDLLLPGQTRRHVDVLRGVDDSSLAASARSTRSLSLHGSMTGGPTEIEHDFSCPSGVETYLNNNKVHHITKGRMDTNYFNRRLDGQRHAWIHALNKHHCQYCHYMWANEFDDAQRVSFHYKKQNKYKITF